MCSKLYVQQGLANAYSDGASPGDVIDNQAAEWCKADGGSYFMFTV